MDFLNHKEGAMVFYQVFLLSPLKVVGNEKLGGSRGWLLVDGDTGLI